MRYVLTLIADRTATSLTHATLDRIRGVVDGGVPEVLSPGEAADIDRKSVV